MQEITALLYTQETFERLKATLCAIFEIEAAYNTRKSWILLLPNPHTKVIRNYHTKYNLLLQQKIPDLAKLKIFHICGLTY